MSKKKRYHKWNRVISFGENLDDDNKLRHNRNEMIFNSALFKKACELAHIEPTKRQASKWNNGKGIARKYELQAAISHKIQKN